MNELDAVQRQSGHWTERPVQEQIGGVAQWLGRRSVAGGLFLIYAWSMVEVW